MIHRWERQENVVTEGGKERGQKEASNGRDREKQPMDICVEQDDGGKKITR